MLKLESRLAEIKGVGPTLAKRLGKINLLTVFDLLNHFPVRYEDFSRLTTINNLKIGQQVTIKGKLQLINSRRSWKKRITITEALIKDTTGSIKAVWFNQPYLAKSLKPGDVVMVAGTLSASSYGLQLEHPTIEPVEKSGLHTGRLVPIYSSTSQLGQRFIRNLIARLMPLARTLPDELPSEIINKFKLPHLQQAVYSLHFPGSIAELTAARRRLVFEELLLIHLKNLQARQVSFDNQAPVIPFSNITKELVSALPWSLTNDQKLATWEIIKDINKPKPMYRLLQGDVGSGKTVVAGIASFNCIKAGWQTALLAPTEILAQQHFVSLSNLLTSWGISCALLTRSHHQTNFDKPTTSGIAIKRAIKSGQINLIIGTHALLQPAVAFHKLGLVIVDEQHRFGVSHRQALLGTRSPAPHLLSMTATPIPRSLALTLYGDLDVSLIKNLPPGRLPVATSIITPPERNQAYELIKREISQGNRAFIVCPLIEESDALGVRAATSEHKRLQNNIFAHIKIGLLHGKLSARDKTKIMTDFKNGQTPILVTTSVIEVGVDVPEATVMAIEGAERFGLAQLHQFRGRVGRSSRPSFCLLMTDNLQSQGLARLKAMTKFSSGFALAEFDLKSRGPGDLLGESQSGFLKLRFAELATTELLKTVREAAQYLISLDSSLVRWPTLKAKIKLQTFHPE